MEHEGSALSLKFLKGLGNKEKSVVMLAGVASLMTFKGIAKVLLKATVPAQIDCLVLIGRRQVHSTLKIGTTHRLHPILIICFEISSQSVATKFPRH